MSKIINYIFKKRYFIAAAIIILLTLCKISGSSIGEWNNFFNDGERYDGVLLGTSRSIRSDEWAVFTPMAMSQVHSDFSYYNDVMRGTSTDMFIEYGQPVLDYSIIFRPFQIGYLFLGAEMGLSFYWISRFVMLFLISFEFCYRILVDGSNNTNRKYLFSFIYSSFLSLSPLIQWWFSVNGLVEMLFFAQLSLIIFNQYFKETKNIKKLIYTLIISWCACGYILTFYPAWQVPIGYILLAFILYIIIKNKSDFIFKKNDFINIIIFITFIAVNLFYIFHKSWTTILSILNTVYPGARAETGGNCFYNFFYYTINLFTPFDSNLITSNQCEVASFFSLFPLNIIIAIITFYHLYKKGKKDLLLILLFIFNFFLSFYCIYGFPQIISKVTLLTQSQSDRAVAIVNLINLIILIRSIYLVKENEINIFKPVYTIFYICCIEFIVFFSNKAFPQYLTKQRLLIINLILVFFLFIIYLYLNKSNFSALITFSLILCIICGATVNPVQQGLDAIYGHSIIKKIEQLNTESPGTWIVAQSSFPQNNIPILVGAPCINSTNIYPNLDLWHSIDKEKTYENIYNRYAHINITLQNTGSSSFELIQTDSFEVHLNLKDLDSLNVDYILTQTDLSNLHLENYDYTLVYNHHNYYVYQKTIN